MEKEKMFQLVNLTPIPLWLAMMFAPRQTLTQRAARSSTIFGLTAVNYLISLILAIITGQDEEGLPDFTTLTGVRKGLSSDGGALGAWSHMVALDLFTGAWIYRQCVRLNAPAWVRIPSLFFTLMTGPFGLLLFFIWRLTTGKGEAISPQ